MPSLSSSHQGITVAIVVGLHVGGVVRLGLGPLIVDAVGIGIGFFVGGVIDLVLSLLVELFCFGSVQG